MLAISENFSSLSLAFSLQAKGVAGSSNKVWIDCAKLLHDPEALSRSSRFIRLPTRPTIPHKLSSYVSLAPPRAYGIRHPSVASCS